jgi:mono/diheme cytochrome c family protein
MSRWSLVVGGAGLAVVAVAALGAAALLRGGISARPEPSAIEARIAPALRNLAIPSAARAARNPIAPSPEVLAAGLAHFADHCALCHANDGSGSTTIGGSLYPRAPDMRRGATQDLTDGELFYLIEQGVRFTGMPAWGGPGTAEGSWHLVHFIRHLPNLTAEERLEMERLNPRSPAEWRALEEEDSFLRGGAPPAPAPGHGAHAH